MHFRGEFLGLLLLLLTIVTAQEPLLERRHVQFAPPVVKRAVAADSSTHAVVHQDAHAALSSDEDVRSITRSDKDGSSQTLWATTLLAGVGGSMSATGANILAWSAYRVRTTGQEWSCGMQYFFYVFCFFSNLAGIGMFAASTALGGAVAVVMPIQTGANLLVNMFWQISLGIKRFNKEMRIGTLVLVCAVAELGEVGPEAPATLDIKRLLLEPQAICWMVFLVVCTVLGLISSYMTFKQPIGSWSKLCSITTVVTLTTVIGSSMSKAFGLLSGSELIVPCILYFFDGVVLMYFTILGNAHCDVSIYIPFQLATQLVVNMFTGYFIWGDAKYIDKPFTYMLVYVISLLGVYLISPELDTMGQLIRHYYIRQGRLSRFFASSDFGKTVLRLLGIWQQHRGQNCIEDQCEQAMCMDAMIEALENGLSQGFLTGREVGLLAVLLLKDKGFGPNATFVHWLEQHVEHFKLYIKHDPNFKDNFRETLSIEERERLLKMTTADTDIQPAVRSGVSLQPVPAQGE